MYAYIIKPGPGFTMPCVLVFVVFNGLMLVVVVHFWWICCFSTEHAALRRKSKYGLPRNQNNVCMWSDISILGLLFQWASTIKIQFSVLVLYLIIISLIINLFSPWYGWKIVQLALNNTHSLTHFGDIGGIIDHHCFNFLL